MARSTLFAWCSERGGVRLMGHSRSLSRTTFRDEADAIDAALRADAERLFSMLFGKPDPATTRGPEWKFPGHGGLYAVVRSSGRKKRGAWFLHGQKKGGGPIGAIMFIHGCSFSEALAIARSFLGLAAGTSMPALSAEARAKREIEAAQAAAQEWAEYRQGRRRSSEDLGADGADRRDPR